MPLARTEVVAATVGKEIFVLGGIPLGAARRSGSTRTTRPVTAWRRVPNLPLGVHHAMAAGAGGRLYVFGGYSATGVPQRTAWVLEGRRWRALPPDAVPARGGRCGVREREDRRRGRRRGRPSREVGALLRRRGRDAGGRSRADPARAPGRHLARRNRLRGRGTHGRDRHEPARLRVVSPGPAELDAASRRSRIHAEGRARLGSTGRSSRSAARSRRGRSPRSSRTASPTGRWVQLESLRTPRHGLGVAAFGGRVFVIGGGPEPGADSQRPRTSRCASPVSAGPRRRAARRGCGRAGSAANTGPSPRSRAGATEAVRRASLARSPPRGGRAARRGRSGGRGRSRGASCRRVRGRAYQRPGIGPDRGSPSR